MRACESTSIPERTVRSAGDPSPPVGDASPRRSPLTRRHLLTRTAFLPYMGLHVACLAIIWVGWSPVAVGTAVALYLVRMFAITGWYHRYFSHRTFRTSRAVQFVFAWIGCSAGQRGPLWWAAHHRHHHRHSDQPPDRHSPRLWGLLWAHMIWFWTEEAGPVDERLVKDLVTYPELRWLERHHVWAPASLAVMVAAFGAALGAWVPSAGTGALQMLVWGFCISTVATYHGTYTINSFSHRYGTRRFATRDDSRNNPLLAIITLGEGWHNNHHRYPGSTRQGFYWWEYDITFYGLWLMSKVGLVWGLRGVPERITREGRAASSPS